MKKTKKFLSMAVLALVGAVMTGCSGDDDGIAETPQQPGNKGNVVTLTTTVGLEDGGAQTRALTGGGVKTFAEGETMAVVYNNGSTTVKAVSHPLDADDIAVGAKSATFTFDLESPNTSVDVTYIYPAAMANSDGSINYDALDEQDGTLATLSSSLDLATYSGAWAGASLPSATLTNQLAILALTLKIESEDNAGWNDYTGDFSQVTVSDGTNTYTLDATENLFHSTPIYVAMKPVTTETALSISANFMGPDGEAEYVKTGKTMTARTYPTGSFSNLPLRMYKSGEEPDEIWDFSKLSSGGCELQDGGYNVGGDVTLAGHGYLTIENDNGYISEYEMKGLTFIASDRPFTRIVIYFNVFGEFYGNGWSVGLDKATWSGSSTWSGSAQSVNFHCNKYITSIQFTFQ